MLHNRVKKFYKKPFNAKLRTGEVKGNFSGKVSAKKMIEKKEAKGEESKAEKKLKGDSVVDCHYSNVANHMANDCM